MRIRSSARLILVSFATAMMLFSSTARAQDSGKAHPAKDEARPPRQESIYRLDYVLRELENGKRTNSRTYTLMATTSIWPSSSAGFGEYRGLHVGSRIPMSMGKDNMQYFDLGVKINSRLKQGEDGLLIDTNLEVNSVADSSSGGAASSTLGNGQGPTPPVIRSLTLSSVTQAVPGKPALVGSVDDVTGNRRYEIEVIATKEK